MSIIPNGKDGKDGNGNGGNGCGDDDCKKGVDKMHAVWEICIIL